MNRAERSIQFARDIKQLSTSVNPWITIEQAEYACNMRPGQLKSFRGRRNGPHRHVAGDLSVHYHAFDVWEFAERTYLRYLLAKQFKSVLRKK